MVNLLSAVTLLVGALVGLITGTLLSPQIKSLVGIRPAVEISSPEPGVVGRTEPIRGTVKNIPAGHYVWLVIQGIDTGNKYFPYERSCSTGPDGKLICDDVYVGADKDFGKRFRIIAVDADAVANSAFLQYNASEASREFRGIEVLPAGANILDVVEVQRDHK